MRHLQGIYPVLPSAVRNATQNITMQTIYGSTFTPGGAGLVAYLNISAVPTVETTLLALQEQDPITGVWATVSGIATSASAAIRTVKLKVFPSIVAVAPTANVVQVSDILPPIWRLQITHSAAGNWTYSLAVGIYNYNG